MIQTILLTALSSQLTSTNPTQTPDSPTPQVVFTRVLPQENYVSYVVGKNDTLKSIALAYYGSEDAWTTLVKDNPQITDPDNLVEGTLVKIRVETNQTQTFSLEDAQKAQSIAAQLQEPTAGTSATPTIIDTPVPTDTIMPTAIPTATPTIEEPTPSIAVTVEPTAVPTAAVSNPASPISDEAITFLGNCEAGMNPTRNSGNGYYGAFQFSYGTWKSMNTGYERADLAPLEVQKAAVRQLLQRSSIYNQFPACARKMHSEGII